MSFYFLIEIYFFKFALRKKECNLIWVLWYILCELRLVVALFKDAAIDEQPYEIFWRLETKLNLQIHTFDKRCKEDFVFNSIVSEISRIRYEVVIYRDYSCIIKNFNILL